MERLNRRGFFAAAGLAGLGTLGLRTAAAGEATSPGAVGEQLMVEHGVVQRLMTVFEECADRLEAGRDVPPGAIVNAGALIDEFVEAHHEEFEQGHVYPLFGTNPDLAPLIGVLVRQHAVGRRLAGRAIFFAGKGDLTAPPVGKPLARICRGYARMYRAHAAHEDTRLFSHLRGAVSKSRFDELGARLVESRQRHIGAADLGGILERLTEIEGTLGLEELDHFTAIGVLRDIGTGAAHE